MENKVTEKKLNLADVRRLMDGIDGPRTLEIMREFAVLILLTEIEGELCFVFEKRAAGIRQPGDICFPGGKVEPGESLAECALRETEEEIGIRPSDIEVLGEFAVQYELTSIAMHSIVGFVQGDVLTGGRALGVDQVAQAAEGAQGADAGAAPGGGSEGAARAASTADSAEAAHAASTMDLAEAAGVRAGGRTTAQRAASGLPGVKLNPSEVAECFTVPVRFFAETEPYLYDYDIVQEVGDFPYEEFGINSDYRWRRGHKTIALYRYGDRVIWGLTAAIVRRFVADLQPLQPE